jgi:hypothetical protein
LVAAACSPVPLHCGKHLRCASARAVEFARAARTGILGSREFCGSEHGQQHHRGQDEALAVGGAGSPKRHETGIGTPPPSTFTRSSGFPRPRRLRDADGVGRYALLL